jgi:hypothetical protein
VEKVEMKLNYPDIKFFLDFHERRNTVASKETKERNI